MDAFVKAMGGAWWWEEDSSVIELFNDPEKCEEFIAADPTILRAVSASGEVPLLSTLLPQVPLLP